MVDLVPDILEDIFLRLPLKSLLKSKIVSKQWKSVIESKSFTERRMKMKKKLKILAVGDQRAMSRFQGDEEGEIEMVYMNCDDAKTRPLLTCDGLVCIPVPGWVNILNASTGQVVSFSSGPDPGPNPYGLGLFTDPWWDSFPGYWEMGFGKDIVSGSYKILRMYLGPNPCCEILDVNIGEWRKLSPPPPYRMFSRRKPACVNGSIYWLELNGKGRLLAIDLHTEEFRFVPVPRVCSDLHHLVNLEGRLAIARPSTMGSKLEIEILDAQEKTWTMTYSINLQSIVCPRWWTIWYRPVAVSEQGNIYFHDNQKRLFKYCSETDLLSCLSSDVYVISPFVENLVSFRPSSVSNTSSMYLSVFHSLDDVPSSRISKVFGRIKLQIPHIQIPNIVLTTSLVSLIMLRYFVIFSRS